MRILSRHWQQERPPGHGKDGDQWGEEAMEEEEWWVGHNLSVSPSFVRAVWGSSRCEGRKKKEVQKKNNENLITSNKNL